MSNDLIVKIENSFSSIKLPQYEERTSKSKRWVEWGSDNLFPNYLISLLSKSPRHAAIIKKKAMLSSGRGFITTNLGIETMMFLKNTKNECDLEEILYKIGCDLEIFGGFTLNIIWSKDRTKISEINYVDISKVRIEFKEEDDDSDIENYYISEGWESIRKYEPIRYAGFSKVNRKEASQILMVKAHRGGSGEFYYPVPDYLPALYWMELELKISEYHLSSIMRGFHPSFHINWPIGNNMSDEERRNLANRLKMQFGGSVQAGESFISFADTDESKPTITPIMGNASDERYIQIDSLIEKGILHAHRVNDPKLFGVETPGKLGNSGETDRIQSMQEFCIDYVIPQQRIIEKCFNKLARINEIEDNIMINRYQDAYKKVGGDSSKDILDIISNTDITPEQKYFLLISLNYDHNMSSKLSGYSDGHNLKVTSVDTDKEGDESIKKEEIIEDKNK